MDNTETLNNKELHIDFANPKISDKTVYAVCSVDKNDMQIERVNIGDDCSISEDVIIEESKHHSHDHEYGDSFDSEIITDKFVSQIEDDPILSMLEEDSYINCQKFLADYHNNKQDSPARFSFKIKHIGDSDNIRMTRDEYISEFKKTRVVGDYFGNRVLVNTNRDKSKEFIFGYQVADTGFETADQQWERTYRTIQELDDDKALREYFADGIKYDATINPEKLQQALQVIAKQQAKRWVDVRKADTLKELQKLKQSITFMQSDILSALENLNVRVTAAINELNETENEEETEENMFVHKAINSDTVEKLEPILLNNMEHHIQLSQQKTVKELGEPLNYDHLERKPVKGYPTINKQIDDYTVIRRGMQSVKRVLPKV